MFNIFYNLQVSPNSNVGSSSFKPLLPLIPADAQNFIHKYLQVISRSNSWRGHIL